MSKRGADEYITKEHGSIPNDVSEGAKVKMATAAQLAKRKMAVPKSRAGRTGQSPLPGAGAPNPFAGTPMFNSAQSSQTFANPGGVTFGASQSFPPGDSTPSNGFNFTVPGQSTSFTFGQPAPNNPFAGLNGNTNNQPQPAPDTNDITMESPQKKPAFGGNMFGTSNNNGEPASTGFAFGQPTSKTPSSSGFAFGQNQPFGGTSGTPLFGQAPSKSPEPSTTPNLFGQSSQPQNNASTPSTLFGQSQENGQQAQPSAFSFGKPATSNSSSSSPFKFGDTNPSTTSSTPSFGFGQPTQAAPNVFGNLGQSSQPSSQPLFGSSTSVSQPAVSAPLFGAPQAAPAPNLFAGFGGSKPDEPAKTISTPEQKQPAIFGQPAAESGKDQGQSLEPDTQDKSKVNPFAGLFAQSMPKQTESSTTSSTGNSKALFDFGKPAPSSTLFSPQKTTETDSVPKASQQAPPKALFSFGTPAATPASTDSSSMKQSAEPSKGSNPFSGLSSQSTKSGEPKPAQSLFGSPKDQPTTNGTGFKPSSSFGDTSSSKPSTPAISAGSNMFGGFGGSQLSGSNDASKPLSDEPEPSKPRQSATTFGNVSATNPADLQRSTPDLFITTVDAAATTVTAPPVVNKDGEVSSNPQRSVNTNPPPRVPPYLNGDDYKAYDSNYRLHSLNREFQKRIASLDPSRFDFENILRNYVAARESIGESIGLYTRNIAGMKRKVDDENDHRDTDESSAKRPKAIEDTPSKPVFSTGQSSNAVFKPLPSSTTKSAAPSSANTPSKSSVLFSSMIPNSTSAPAQSSSNPFANLGKSVPSSNNGPTNKPALSFGSSTNAPSVPAGSTTPIKSPPKNAGFQMPTFSAPAAGVSFMDAFKKQSEQSAAQLAKKAKEKRKAEEFDSDEDDEEEWNRKYEEEERAKKSKVDAVARKGFVPTFGSSTASAPKPSASFGASSATSNPTPKPVAASLFGNQQSGAKPDQAITISDNDASGEDDAEEGSGDSGNAEEDDEEGEEEDDEVDKDDLPEDDVNGEAEDEEEEDMETAMARSRNRGKSLFERVTPNPSMQKTSAPASTPVQSIEQDKVLSQKPAAFGSLFGKNTPETPSFSPLTPASTSKPFVPSSTFNFTSTPPPTTSSPLPGASIFSGGALKEGPVVGEGLFGSRPSTPSNADKSKSLFGTLGSSSFGPSSDHTWKKGSEIKFGASTTEAPSVNITEPTPHKQESKPFASLFGLSSGGSNSGSDAGTGFAFGQSPAPGFLSAASHLTGGSGTNSGFSSRATSPGTTDNESVATNEEDYSNDTQLSLMETREGGEDENIILEARTKLMKHYSQQQVEGTKLTPGWNTVGLGTARLLKHKKTGKTRLVMRAEPGANVILNTNLQAEANYVYAPSKDAGTVKFSVFTNDGVDGYFMKVKTQQLGQELAKAMQDNKGSKA